ncbi:hypothetical protein B5E92_13540 [Erysipelatoclostridium sp. An15]|uniref:hypothetical protein n=1 Tax=Erysipelatoclostridium sp. An15 TaxID=1965566 RepID=UPI000B37757C|nr:hypothetical protein [Erysipelatoclostridium sp. An15]OUQ04019.1 hypothetical protein B5E92_13540 [Erysipelatoclostridium sp. An15]
MKKNIEETLNNIKYNDLKNFKILDISGIDEDIERLDALNETILNHNIAGFIVKTKYLDYIHQDIENYTYISKEEFLSDENPIYKQDFKNGITFYQKRENSQVFLTGRVHGQHYSVDSNLLNVETQNEYIAIDDNYKKLYLANNDNQNLQFIFEKAKKECIQLNRDLVNKVINNINEIYKIQAVKKYLIDSPYDYDKFLETTNDPKFRYYALSYRFPNQSGYENFKEYHLREILCKANEYMINENLSYNPIIVGYPNNSIEDWYLYKIDAVNINNPKDHTVWTSFNISGKTPVLNNGHYNLKYEDVFSIIDVNFKNIFNNSNLESDKNNSKINISNELSKNRDEIEI